MIEKGLEMPRSILVECYGSELSAAAAEWRLVQDMWRLSIVKINWSLADLKLVYLGQIKWGKLYGRLLEDGSVMEFAWKDADIVLFMSTVDSGMFIIKNKALRIVTSYIAR